MSKEYAKVNIQDDVNIHWEKRLTAKEAREMMTEKHWLEKHVYNWIKDLCCLSKSSITINSTDYDCDEIRYALDSLEKNGYNISIIYETVCSSNWSDCEKKVVTYKISW